MKTIGKFPAGGYFVFDSLKQKTIYETFMTLRVRVRLLADYLQKLNLLLASVNQPNIFDF